MMSTFPIVLGESLFRVHLPVAVVLLGPVIGTMHLLLNLFASDLQTLGAILYTRLVLHKKPNDAPVKRHRLKKEKSPSPAVRSWEVFRRHGLS
ncbi:MAG TPA: hypothetical protein PK272_03125 [Methanoregulaceae archaeon]|nr:hypothetical protein [Methanoregulaceae archaeon]HNW80312.1 hypothetical protein [Methanoregulaceae archaeon]